MMKLAKRAAALVLAAVLALSLTACSPKEVASNLILLILVAVLCGIISIVVLRSLKKDHR